MHYLLSRLIHVAQDSLNRASRQGGVVLTLTGLQADYVFVTGLVDGVLPNVTKGIDTVEAQRRLLYVGITRTIKRLYLISTVSWGKEVHKLDKSQFKYSYRAKVWAGRTSRFVDEMK
jgi:superfamily I DNA/RNA helicase